MWLKTASKIKTFQQRNQVLVFHVFLKLSQLHIIWSFPTSNVYFLIFFIRITNLNKRPIAHENSMSISGFLIRRKDILNYVLQKIDYNEVAGLNIVTGKMVIKCQNAFKYLTLPFIIIFQSGYCPQNWKTSLATMIPKVSKDLNLATMAQSVFSKNSKSFEILLLQKSPPFLINENIRTDNEKTCIDDRQICRMKQVHRVVVEIRRTLKDKRYYFRFPSGRHTKPRNCCLLIFTRFSNRTQLSKNSQFNTKISPRVTATLIMAYHKEAFQGQYYN